MNPVAQWFSNIILKVEALAPGNYHEIWISTTYIWYIGEAVQKTQQTLTFYELDLGLNHVVRKYSEPLGKSRTKIYLKSLTLKLYNKASYS